MFENPLIDPSTHARTGTSQWISEFVATFGLVATILGLVKSRPEAIPYAVGLYITAAYWFTSSTSFANPAVTIARGFSDTFAGIDPKPCSGIYYRPANCSDCRDPDFQMAVGRMSASGNTYSLDEVIDHRAVPARLKLLLSMNLPLC